MVATLELCSTAVKSCGETSVSTLPLSDLRSNGLKELAQESHAMEGKDFQKLVQPGGSLPPWKRLTVPATRQTIFLAILEPR